MTIITPALDAEATLRRCLDSAAAQSMAFEHILIDGASSDNTLSIAREYSHIDKIVSEPDGGIYDAVNKGLGMAKGDVVGILNADDCYADGKTLERVVRAFDKGGAEACYGDLVYARPPDFKVVRYWKAGRFRPEKFFWGWMPPHPAFFVHRKVYEMYGKFRLDLGSAADYELMMRFLLKRRVKAVYVPEILVIMAAGGISNRSLSNRLRANLMDRRAWKLNGIKPFPWTLWLKPLRKAPQYFLKPPEGKTQIRRRP